MKYNYYFAYSSLAILLAAFIPAMIAASRERRFSRWYLYSVVLFPIAFIHALLLKKPVHYINIFRHDAENPARIKKKSYRKLSIEKKQIIVTPGYLYKVFFSKLLFGAFAGIVLFALFRTLVYSTDSLVTACIIFSVVFATFLSIVEICRFSTLPLIADEITKRAVFFAAISFACSLPLLMVYVLLLQKVLDKQYLPVSMFICTMISFGLFLFLLFRRQRFFYRVFSNFFDYCIISIASYGVFAAMSLIWLSISGLQKYIYIFAMPMQLFNLNYLAKIERIGRLPYIYSSALVHLFIAALLLLSGLLCRNFKRKEFEYRVEYRSKAFRMSRKPILKRRLHTVSSAK